MSRNRAALWGVLAAVLIVATSLILPSLGSDGEASSSTEDLPPLRPFPIEIAVSIGSILLVFLVAFVVIRLLTKHRADQH